MARSKRTASSPPEKSKPFGLSTRDALHDPLQMGITIVGVTAVFGGAGWWLDSKLGTFPILMALGAAAGLFGIIYLIYVRLRQAEQRRPDATSSETEKEPE